MPKLRVPNAALDTALRNFGTSAIFTIAVSVECLPLPVKAKAAQVAYRHG